MKTLLLLRDAKSSWEDGNLADFDRSLNARGRSDAPRMGRLLAQYELTPDLIVTSAARRAATTAELIALAAEYAGDIQYTNELYLADPETFLDVALDTADGVARLMLVGLGTKAGYDCPLSQYLLADALGLSAVHINRVLRQLREDGLMTFRDGKVIFDNFDGLVALAEFDLTYLDQAGPLLG